MPIVVSIISLGLLGLVAPKLAFLMVAIAFGAAGAELFRKHLREDRTEVRGVADVLPYGFLVADGTVLNKDGALSRGILFRGPDGDGITPDEKAAVAEYIGNAFAKLGDGWGFHVDEVRRASQDYPAGGAFPDAISRLVDQERRASYEMAGRHYESDYYMVATYVPPSPAYSKWLALFEDGATSTGDVDWGVVLERFHNDFAELVDRLRGRLYVEPLSSAALMRHLHVCLTGLHHRVRVPEDGAYLNVHLADQELIGGFEPRIGAKHIRVVAVQDYPWKPEPAVLGALGKLPFAYRWSSRLVLLPKEQGEREIKNARRGWRVEAALRSLLGGARKGAASDSDQNQDAPPLSMEADAEAALALSEGGARFLYYTNCIVLHEDDAAQADGNARELLRILNDLGFTGRIETVNAVDAFYGTLPGLFYPNLRRPLIHTENLGNLFPSTAQWAGLEHNPSPYLPENAPPLMIVETAGSTPHRLNTDYFDNGNALVLGPPMYGVVTVLRRCRDPDGERHWRVARRGADPRLG